MTHLSCPIKGHAHFLVVQKEHTQAVTGAKARTFECPTGRYRWFVLEGHSVQDPAMRQTRPRWGWRK